MKTPIEVTNSPPAEDKPEWAGRLENQLAQAAKLATDHGVTPEAFAAVSWHSYLHASPAFAAQLEQLQFAASMEVLRNSGRLAKA